MRSSENLYRRPSGGRRPGFAAALALLVLVALALLGALAVDAALGSLRTGTAALVEARARALAESGLARALVQRLDSTARRVPAGSMLMAFADSDDDGDSVTVRAQVVQPGVARILVTAIARRGRFRGIAGRYAFAAMAGDSVVPGEVTLSPLGALWWAAVP